MSNHGVWSDRQSAPVGVPFPVRRRWKRIKRETGDGVFYVSEDTDDGTGDKYVISPRVRQGSRQMEYVLTVPPGVTGCLSVHVSLRKAMTAAELWAAGYDTFVRRGHEVKPVRAKRTKRDTRILKR